MRMACATHADGGMGCMPDLRDEPRAPLQQLGADALHVLLQQAQEQRRAGLVHKGARAACDRSMHSCMQDITTYTLHKARMPSAAGVPKWHARGGKHGHAIAGRTLR